MNLKFILLLVDVQVMTSQYLDFRSTDRHCSSVKAELVLSSTKKLNANQHMHANPVNFVFVLGARNRDKVVKVQEPSPNHLIKQQQEIDSWNI